MTRSNRQEVEYATYPGVAEEWAGWCYQPATNTDKLWMACYTREGLYVVRFGRRGSKLQTRETKYDSRFKAMRAYLDKVYEQERVKGYRQVPFGGVRIDAIISDIGGVLEVPSFSADRVEPVVAEVAPSAPVQTPPSPEPPGGALVVYRRIPAAPAPPGPPVTDVRAHLLDLLRQEQEVTGIKLSGEILREWLGIVTADGHVGYFAVAATNFNQIVCYALRYKYLADQESQPAQYVPGDTAVSLMEYRSALDTRRAYFNIIDNASTQDAAGIRRPFKTTVKNYSFCPSLTTLIASLEQEPVILRPGLGRRARVVEIGQEDLIQLRRHRR